MSIRNIFFKNIGIRQTIIKNTFWLSAAEFVIRLTGLFLAIYVARVLGALEYGKFTFALFFASLAAVFSDLGVADIAVREFSRNDKQEKKISGIFTLELILCSFAFAIAIAGSFFITSDGNIRHMMWVLAIFVATSNLIAVIFSFLRSRQVMEYEFLIKFFQSVIVVSAVFFIAYFLPTAVNISYGYLISNLVILLFLLRFFKFYFHSINLEFKKNIFEILKISWPLSFGFIPGWIYISINSVELGYLGMITENGWYGAASRVAIGAMIVATLTIRSFYPALSSLFFSSKEKISSAWNYFASSVVFLVVPITVGGITLSHKIINFLYGSDFYPSVYALKLLMIVVAISFLNYPYTIMLVVAGHQRKNFILMLFGAAVNIFLSFILIGYYGFYGSIFSAIAASIFVLVSTIILSWKNNIAVAFNKIFLKITVMSGVAGVIMYLIINYKPVYEMNLLIVGAVASTAYLAIFFLMFKMVFAQGPFLFLKRGLFEK